MLDEKLEKMLSDLKNICNDKIILQKEMKLKEKESKLRDIDDDLKLSTCGRCNGKGILQYSSGYFGDEKSNYTCSNCLGYGNYFVSTETGEKVVYYKNEDSYIYVDDLGELNYMRNNYRNLEVEERNLKNKLERIETLFEVKLL